MKQTSFTPTLTRSLAGLCLALVAFLMFLAGCGRNYRVSESWDFNGLRLTLSSPQFHYEIGDEVTITATVENTSRQTILWESARTDHPEYVFDVKVEGTMLSELYPELQVYSRELKPGEKVEIVYIFTPEKQEPHYISIDAYLYHDKGMIRSSENISVEYGAMAK